MNGYQQANIAMIVCILIASPIVGAFVAKNASKNRMSDVLGLFGETNIAAELRQSKPVVPYYIIGSLAGLLVGLGIHLVGTVTLLLNEVDLFPYKTSLILFLPACMATGFVAAGLAGLWVLRKGS